MPSELSTRASKRLLKQNLDLRVSEDAANQFGSVLEGHAKEITQRAVEIMEEEGLKTLRASHVNKAIRDKKEVNREVKRR
jgi:histone H3/H4